MVVWAEPTAMQGVTVQLTVDDPGGCPVAAASARAGPASGVTWTGETGDDAVAEEFTLRGDADLDGPAPVARDDRATTYRFTRDRDADCVCALVEAAGHPLSRVSARDGSLRLTFRVPDPAEVRPVVTAVRDAFDGVTLEALTRTGDDEADPVVVDRGRLTDRQLEVLETACERGYFDHPREANASEVADALGVAPSTFREHLAAAQRKVMAAVVDA